MYPDQITNSIQSIFPGFVLQRVLNSLGTRQIITHSVDKFQLVWTLIGLEEDTEEQTHVRLKQSNLVGPAGLVSMEDGAIGGFVQKRIRGDLKVRIRSGRPRGRALGARGGPCL